MLLRNGEGALSGGFRRSLVLLRRQGLTERRRVSDKTNRLGFIIIRRWRNGIVLDPDITLRRCCENIAARFRLSGIHVGLVCLWWYVRSLTQVILDNYRAASIWLAPNSGEGRGSGDRFLWRGKTGAFVL
jgi:hypothetical protein